MRRLLFGFLWTSLSATVASGARPPTDPGAYVDWAGKIDHVVINDRFHLHDYVLIDVLPPDVSAIEIPTDNTRDPVRGLLIDAAHIVADELDSSFPNRMHIKADVLLTGMHSPPRTLLLRIKFLSVQPGSRAKRNLTLGNLGKVRMSLTGDLIDADTGSMLLRFALHNNDGGHGDYEHVLKEDLEHIMDRVGLLFKAFYP